MSATGVAFDVYIEGMDGNDVIIGGNGSDRLVGDEGDDRLYGGDGHDVIDGGDGNDWLYGGAGFNQLDGGAGDDTYVFRNEGVTTVTDVSGENWLRFEGDGSTYITKFYVDSAGSLVKEGSNGSIITIADYQSSIVGINWVSFSNQVGWSEYTIILADTPIGTLGADTLRTSSANYVEAYGSDGNDTIYINATKLSWVSGDGGSDIIYGGVGQDTIRGDWNSSASGNDKLFGGDGNDNIDGQKGDDSIFGGSGDDQLYGGDGNDTIDDGVGFDTINGGAGVDTFVRFYDGVDYSLVLGFDLTRGLAYSPLDPNSAAEVFIDVENLRVSGGYTFILTGNSANNVLETAGGNDGLYGLSGSDSLTSWAGNDTLDGGAGNDSLTGGTGNDTYIVDSSTDVVVEGGSAGTDLVQSSAATYTLSNNVENLTLMGGAAINGTGNTGSNILTGNSAANSISGGGGNDTIIGGGGNDTLEGAAGNDSLTGGDGIDTASYNGSSLAVTVNLGTPGAQNTGGAGTDTLATVENLIGSAYNDRLTGDANANSLNGGVGNDTLVGGAGNDTILGGGGNDNLTGGVGADVFVFNTAPNATSNLDTITDFASGTDRIHLAKSAMAALGTVNSTLIGDAFWQGAGVIKGHDASDRIVYNTSTGALYYDADGSGSGAAVKLAQLGTTASHPASIIAADFFVF